MLIWTIIIFSSKVLIHQSDFFKNLLNGSPQVLIKQGRIDVATALRSGVSASSLVFKLNNAGVDDLQQVSKVTLEQNGELQVDNYHDTIANLPVITDGNINHDVLKHVNRNQQWLIQLVQSQKHEIRDVYLGQIAHGDLILTLYPKQTTPVFKFSPNQIIHLKNVLN
ncbi:YetF domain-containing protein [Lactobacillaceae bacterium Scapto_B20]